MKRLLPMLLALSSCATPSCIPPKAEVLFFITTDCPISNSFAPEVNRIVEEYSPKGVYFLMVYSDLTQSGEAIRRHRTEFGYKSPVQVDTGHVLSRQHGITVTPEALVLVHDERVYRGRIDDRYLAPGKYRLQPTTHELRDAIEAVLAGRPVPVAETKAAGCPLTD